MSDPGRGQQRTPAEEHREIAGLFSRRVRDTARDAWDNPAPPAGWAARDVVRHLQEWFPPFLVEGCGERLRLGPSVDVDPVAAWEVQRDAVQALLDDPSTASRSFRHPRLAEQPLADAIDRFYTADVFMHTWDLARATGQDSTLDPDKCADLLAGMEPMEQAIRASGQFGRRIEVPADSDPQTRLLAFIGRDPDWRPPSLGVDQSSPP